MQEVFIVSAARTPIGRFGGSLSKMSPADLGAVAIRGSLEKGGVDGSSLDHYVMGNVLGAGHGQLIARQSAIKADVPDSVDGYTVDMVCSSGMMATMNGANSIKAGEADLIVTGGTESMSQTGFYLSHRARWGYKFLLGRPEGLVDLLLYDGLTDPFTDEAMGVQTERLAKEHGITREELDAVALESQLRSAKATELGSFSETIIPVALKDGELSADEGIRTDTTMESLSKLRPAFDKEGVLTAANSSQISDGAAALLLASKKAVDEHGLKPIARILGHSISAGESWRFPEAPIPAVKKLVEKLDLELTDFDLFENNEAFAINNILFEKMLGVGQERLNVLGGAIAMGHPIGASGARIIVTLINALRLNDKKHGLASICHGTGGGTAIALEML